MPGWLVAARERWRWRRCHAILVAKTLGFCPRGHPRGYWRRLAREDIVEGARNNTIAFLCGHPLWRGVVGDVIAELMLAWSRSHCRPPLSEAAVLPVFDSVERRYERDGGPVTGQPASPDPAARDTGACGCELLCTVAQRGRVERLGLPVFALSTGGLG